MSSEPQLLRDYQEMMAAAFCKECHILPSEAVMYVQQTIDKDGHGLQRIWFEKKTQ